MQESRKSNSSQRISQSSDKPEEVIPKMNHLYMLLTASPPPKNPFTPLKQYITLYVENHRNNEEVFTQLCEHQILSHIFGFKDHSKNINHKPLCLESLEIFNLLLANSNKQEELGYILSQSSLHQGLFVNALAISDSDFVQYYAQVLKSITMKLTQKENRSLLRVFYNSKYPSFPLMVNCTFLATTCGEQLVKVTARQCVLVLINLLKEKGMSAYLNELPMLIFYARLIEQEKRNIQEAGDIGYIGDLLWAIKENGVASFSLSNAIFNLVFLDNLRNPTVILKFLKLAIGVIRSHAEEEHGSFRNQCIQWVVRMETTFLGILSKFLFNKYLYSQLLAAYFDSLSANHKYTALFPQSLSTKHMIKKINESCSKTFAEVEKEFGKKIIQCFILPSALVLYCQHIENHYSSDRQFIKTKEAYSKKQFHPSPKKQSSFFSTVMKKVSDDYVVNTFLGNVSDAIGFSVVLGKFIKNAEMQKSIDNPNAMVFINELCSNFMAEQETNSNSSLTRYEEIHFNQVRNEWALESQLLNQILNMIMENKRSKPEDLPPVKQSEQIKWSIKSAIYEEVEEDQATGTGKFLNDFKTYLEQFAYIHIQKQKLPLKTVILLERTCTLLNVNISDNSINSLIVKLTILHSHIQACLFQNGFGEITEYMLSPKNQPCNEEHIIQTIIQYDLLHRILRNRKKKHRSLQEFYFKHLQTVEFPEKIFSFCVNFYGQNDCLMMISLTQEPKIEVIITLHGKAMFSIDLLTAGSKLRQNTIKRQIIHFGENSQPIRMISEVQSRNFMEIAKRFKFTVDETVTMAVIEYLEKTMNEAKLLDPRYELRPKSLISGNRLSIHTPQ